MDPVLNFKEVESGIESAWEGYLTIPYVSEWKQKLLQIKTKPGSLWNIDLSSIQRIDTAGIQFLLFLKKYASDKNFQLKLNNHSLPVLKSIDLLGLVNHFGDKIKIKKEYASELTFAYGTKKN
ncbi:lipid asymmetry maintenance protein MlaB [Leptospira sp. 'Mane']|uniref:STAS domain-containing protein n=1 Tax=Leptospira sp. 'Mane' TaxID=3387407 RepID=UPI00398A5CF2